MRLTVAQALVRFLACQYTERDGVERRLISGCLGIFGHGNVAGVGQALLESELEDPERLPYVLARNEQGMVHTAAGFARMSNRLATMACTTSIGPGATNLVTGAALATISRLPVLLLPGDVFATRRAEPVLQQLEMPHAGDISVNDCLRPVSRYFDRLWRPEMLIPAALNAMRVLTDQAETGAVTLALPQDVQTEAVEVPQSFLAKRVWRIPRPRPDTEAMAAAIALVRRSRRPLIVAGGGVIYAEATETLARLCDQTGIPVAETQAGKGALPFDHPSSLGGVGATGTAAANAIARQADLVVGVGTRWTDFTTASHSAFAHPDVRFVNVNIACQDAHKLAGLPLQGDAKSTLEALAEGLAGWQVDPSYRQEAHHLSAQWQDAVDDAYRPAARPHMTQAEVLGALDAVLEPRDVIINASGSLPGDLHRLWRPRDPMAYQVEYGYSCMGYEIAAGLGAKLADPSREVFVLVGDGSYLMLAQELVTAVQEGLKVNVLLVENHGFASIGALSEAVGVQRFGTDYRYRSPASHRLDGALLPVDLAANAASLGTKVLRASDSAGLRQALREARASQRTTVVHAETDTAPSTPDGGGWWEVAVAEVSGLETTQKARAKYEQQREAQRHYL